MSSQTHAASVSQTSDLTDAEARRSLLALSILLCWQLMVVLDGTIVNIALTEIRQSLNFSETGLSWVVNSYALAFGGLLLLGGRMGDILGQRRVLVWGVIIFTVASMVGGIAPSPAWMLAARIAQGVGAAIAAPSTMSLIVTNFPEGPARNRAFALIASVAGVGASIGLILGGVLTSSLSWHWVFFINVPIGIAIAVLAPRWVRESERRSGKFDIVGALTSTVAVSSLVYGFIRASEEGWTNGLTIAAFAMAVVLLITFVVIETRAAQPILPLRLFARRERTVALINMMLVPSAMFGLFFFLTQYMQTVLGFDALQTGFAFLPMTVALVTAARLSQRSIARVGLRTHLVFDASLMIASLLWLTQVTVDSRYVTSLLGPILLLGAGAGSSFPPLSITVMSRLDPADSGSASGLLQTFQQVGGAVGLAILVTVFGTANRNALESGDQPLEALTHGMTQGFLTAALIAMLYLIVSIVGFRKMEPRDATEYQGNRMPTEAH